MLAEERKALVVVVGSIRWQLLGRQDGTCF